jgi:hypothetical protein
LEVLEIGWARDLFDKRGCDVHVQDGNLDHFGLERGKKIQ